MFPFSATFQRAPTLLLLPDYFSQVYHNLFSPLFGSYIAIVPIFPGLLSYKAVTLQNSSSDHTSSRPRSATYLKGSSKLLDLHPKALHEVSLLQLFHPQLASMLRPMTLESLITSFYDKATSPSNALSIRVDLRCASLRHDTGESLQDQALDLGLHLPAGLHLWISRRNKMLRAFFAAFRRLCGDCRRLLSTSAQRPK